MGRADSPHDKLVKEAFGSPKAMRGILTATVTAPILAALDLSSLTAVPGSFVDGQLAASYSDLLFRVLLKDRPALVYVLVEHKSQSDRWVVLQLLRYCVRIWERVLAEHPRVDHLPPILPIVVAHSPGGWTAPRSLGELIDPIATDLPDIARLTPHFEVLVDDLSLATDEQLQARAMGIFATVAAAFLRDARTPERVLPMLHRVSSLLAELWGAPDGRRALDVLLRYLSVVADADVEQVTHIIEGNLPEARELIMTIAEQLEQRGFMRGIERGIEKGIEKGRVVALRATVQKQLQLRFGRIDASAAAHIDAADADALDRYAERLLSAATIDEVFAE